MRQFWALALGSCLLVAVQVGAQERGRLDDGRAYRVGQDGFRLVDEIAELQVSNDDLRKQVAVLESQLDAYEDKSGVPPCKPSVLPSVNSDTPSCDELVSRLYLRISRLETQQRNALGGTMPSATVCDYESFRNPYKTAAQSFESKATKADEELVHISEQLITRTAEVAEKERQIANLQADKGLASSAKVAACNYDSMSNPYLARVKALEEELSRRGSAGSSSRARLATVVTSQTQGSSLSVDLERSKLRSKLAKIDQLISKRKSLYDKVKSKKGMVTLQLQRLETARGMSLDSIRRQINRMKSASRSSSISKSLTQIENLLNEDIKLLKRFLK